MREFYQRDPKKIQERAAKYFEQNRQAQNLNRKIHYNNNVEKHLANSKKWAADNPIRIRVMKAANRAKRKNAPRFQVSHKEVERLLNQQCFYCRVAHSKQIDHIVPLVRGGSHSIGNLIGACARCNQSKNAKTIMEWRLDKMRSI
jgi:5-methylcytosine-specific restriction endonuclease McrA